MSTIAISALPVAVLGDLSSASIVPFDTSVPATKSVAFALLRTALLLGGSGYTGGDALALGATPASAGAIRLSNTGTIKARNAANSADKEVLQITAGDALKLAGLWTFPTADGSASQVLQTDGAGNLSFATVSGGSGLPTTGGTMTGAILFSADNTIDVGAAGATRPRTLYVGTSVIAPAFTGTLTGNVTGNLTGNSAGTHTGAVVGNASTATTLATARNINGVAFDGSAAITVTAAAGTLTGATLASGVTASSLTTFGTLAGSLLFTDATYDIGASGATRPRVGYFSSALAIGTNPASAGAVRLANTDTIKARNAANSGDVEILQITAANKLKLLGLWLLPTADGSANQVLQTDGSGNLSFATVSGGSGLPTTGGTMTGAILFSADNTIDVGAVGATRPRTLYVGTSVIAPNFTGVASSATVLATARNINGVAFDGSGNITVTAAAGTLTGATLASGVTASSLTTFGTLAGALLFTDATYDIGASGATRPRVGYFSSALAIGTNPASAGAIRLANTDTIKARNAANSGDKEVLQITGADKLKLYGTWTFPTADAAGLFKSDGAGAVSLATLVNADVSGAAAIALSKLAGWPADAAGYLNNNGSGTLTWGAPAGTTALTFNTQSGTTYTAVLADADVKLIEMTSSSANTVTIPPHSSVAYAAGAVLQIVQGGTGATTVAAGAGVTIRREPWSAGTGVAKGRGSALTYTQSSTQDTWYESGSLA